MPYDANPAATHDPTTGVVVPTNWLDLINSNFAAIGAAWTAYTPTWGGTSNPVINNGTLTGGYRLLGKTLDLRIYILMGSTTTYGSGGWTLSLPSGVTAAAAAPQILPVRCWDDSAALAYHGAGQLSVSTSSFSMRIHATALSVRDTVPFTWAAGDYLLVQGTIEVA